MQRINAIFKLIFFLSVKACTWNLYFRRRWREESISLSEAYHFHERIVTVLGQVAEGFLQRYGSFVSAIDVHVHASIRQRLMHQDDQALQRCVHRKTVYVDVPGAASTGFIETLENDCTNVNISIRKSDLPPEKSGKEICGLTALRPSIEYKH